MFPPISQLRRPLTIRSVNIETEWKMKNSQNGKYLHRVTSTSREWRNCNLHKKYTTKTMHTGDNWTIKNVRNQGDGITERKYLTQSECMVFHVHKKWESSEGVPNPVPNSGNVFYFPVSLPNIQRAFCLFLVTVPYWRQWTWHSCSISCINEFFLIVRIHNIFTRV